MTPRVLNARNHVCDRVNARRVRARDTAYSASPCARRTSHREPWREAKGHDFAASVGHARRKTIRLHPVIGGDLGREVQTGPIIGNRMLASRFREQALQMSECFVSAVEQLHACQAKQDPWFQ